MVKTKQIGKLQLKNELRLLQTGRVIVQIIFNGKDRVKYKLVQSNRINTAVE